MNEHEKRLRFREILDGKHGGVIAPSVPEPIFARLVQDCGYRLMHIAGNGLHKSKLLADEGLVTMTEAAQRGAEVAEVLDIPLLLDAETGYGGAAQAGRAVQLFSRAGVAGLRLEDSRFGMSGINSRDAQDGVTPVDEMCDKIKAAVDHRIDDAFVIAIRCDARPYESLERIRDRCAAYVEAGADSIGVTVSGQEEMAWVPRHIPRAVLAGFTRSSGVKTATEFFALGYRVAMVPSSVHVAALAAARTMLLELARTGTTDEYFASVPDLAAVRRWYEALGFRTPEPFASQS